MIPWQPRWAALKEHPNWTKLSGNRRQQPALPPLGTVFDDPIRQRALESNVAARLFGFDPLVLQNLFSFGLKLPVERGVSQQLTGRKVLFRFVRHKRTHSNRLCDARM